MSQLIEKLLYKRSLLSFLLWPFSLIFQLITLCRRLFLVRWKQQKFPVPVIVVGNLSMGGVGKTPLVIALAKACLQMGLKPGIISRGYKAAIKKVPHLICPEKDTALSVGDEPLLIAKTTGCPVVIAPNRCKAAQYLLKTQPVDIILSDDGLQHYALGRNVEILVIDGLKGLGNGFCLPAGPLREHRNRLKKADFIVINGEIGHKSIFYLEKIPHYKMILEPASIKNLASGAVVSLDSLVQPIAAVAGIGNPQRFFNTLNSLNIKYTPYAFPDHYQFQPNDFHFIENSVIMTEKDAVKCAVFAKEPWHFLTVEAKLCETFWNHFGLALKDL